MGYIKDKKILIGGLLLLIGIMVGAGGGYMLGKSKAQPATTSSQQSTGSQSAGKKNLYNGDELTLVEMYDSLQSTSGNDFDQRLLVYMLTIHNLESGMLRITETKAQRQPLKDLAKIQREQNEKVIPLMNQWQSDWGFSHH